MISPTKDFFFFRERKRGCGSKREDFLVQVKINNLSKRGKTKLKITSSDNNSELMLVSSTSTTT